MRKLIYTLLILIVIVVIAFLVSPYFLGQKMQKELNSQMEAFNKTSPYAAYITITPESYQRHWFSSDAQVKITLHLPAGMPQQLNRSYTYDATIKHGPLFFVPHGDASTMHWGAGAIVIKGDSQDFDGTIAMVLKLNGQLDTFADIPKLVLHDASGNNYTLTNLSFTTKSDGDNTQYTLSIPKISAQILHSKNAIINVDDFKIVTNGREVNSVWFGTGNLSIDTITVAINEQGNAIPLANVKDIMVTADTNLSRDKTKINSSLNFNIDALDVMGKTVQPITFSYSVNGVDAKAYQQFMTLVRQLERNNPSTNVSTQQGMQLLSALINVIQNGLTVSINKIYVGLPKDLASSSFSAQAQMTIKPIPDLMNKLANDVGAANAMHQPQQQLMAQLVQAMPTVMPELSKAISVRGQASIPQSAVKQLLLHNYTKQLMQLAAKGQDVTQTPQQLADQAYDYLTQNKMLIANDDGSVKMRFTFDNGKFLINGEKPAFDLPKPNLQTMPTITPAQQPSS